MLTLLETQFSSSFISEDVAVTKRDPVGVTNRILFIIARISVLSLTFDSSMSRICHNSLNDTISVLKCWGFPSPFPYQHILLVLKQL